MTENELLLAVRESLERAAEGPEGAMTVKDLSREMGLSRRLVRKQLDLLKEQGRIRTVRVRRPALDDYLRPVTAYQILQTEAQE